MRLDRTVFGSKLILLFGVLIALGCSSRKSGSEVSGNVKYRGQLLNRGEVNFYSKELGVGAVAKIDGSGKFIFDAPLQPGIYQVSVTPPAPEPGPKGPKKSESALPSKFADAATSGLSFNVAAGKNVFPIELND